MSSVTIRGGDGNRYPALVTSEGKLMVDTELTVSGITIENLNVYRDELGNLSHGLVDSSNFHQQVDIHDSDGGTLTSTGGALDVSVTAPDGIGITYQSPVIISGTQNALPVTDNNGSLTVDGTVSVGHPIAISGTQTVTATDLDIRDLDYNQDSVSVNVGHPVIVSGIASTVTVTGDTGGSLTVDNATISVVGGGAEATAQRITIADDSTGVVSVDDNGGSLTVDGIVDLAEAVNISGIATHDATASSVGPQIMGAYDSTKPTAVADGDSVRVLSDQYGRLLAGMEPERFQATIQSFDATSATQVKLKTAAKKMYLTTVAISASGAMSVKLQDDNGTPATIVDETYLPATSSIVLPFSPSAPLVVDTNKDLDVITSAAGGVTVTVAGYLAT